MTRVDAAKTGSQKSIRAMDAAITPAARVRREFRTGRPPKPGESPLLHPQVVWEKATNALANLRGRMSEANLDPNHVSARIVYIADVDFKPETLLIEKAGKSAAEMRAHVIQVLSRDNVMAIGMIFAQFDEHAKVNNFTVFPFQFTTLSEAAVNLLKIAAAQRHAEVAARKVIH